MAMAPGAERPSVLRFTPTERALHWGFALWYLSLLVSGLPLMLPGLRPWIYGWTRLVGVRLHLASAVLWVVVPVLVAALGDRRALQGAARDLAGFRRGDWAWLWRFPSWLISRSGERADVDRFNAGQKLFALFTAATSALLLLTGLALWPLDDSGAVLGDLAAGPRSDRGWRYAHALLTLAIVIPVAWHVLLAVAHPRTRPSLAGMLVGRVDAQWAAAEHPRWLARVSPGPENAPDRSAPPPKSS